MSKSGYKGISRIDQPSRKTFGWFVRVTFNGQRRVKFFSDKANGGRKKALDAAVEYRNRAEKELGKPRTDRQVVAFNPRNSTGIMGIQLKRRYVRGDNGERVAKQYYIVTWNPEPGRVDRVLVPVDKYGEKGALLRACRIRREKEREMYGSVVKINWANNLSNLAS
jgi:hypothetical protein